MSGMLGTLNLSQLVRTAAVPGGSTEGLRPAGDELSPTIQTALKQETIVHLLNLHASNLLDTTPNDLDVVNATLTIASQMLDRGDCTQATFVRLQTELPKMIHSWRDKGPTKVAKATWQQAMDIIDGVTSKDVCGYSEPEARLMMEFTAAREHCAALGQKVVDMVYGQVRNLVPDMVKKYPDLKDTANGPFTSPR